MSGQYKLLYEKYQLVIEGVRLSEPCDITKGYIKSFGYKNPEEFLEWIKNNADDIFDWIHEDDRPISVDDFIRKYIASYQDILSDEYRASKNSKFNINADQMAAEHAPKESMNEMYWSFNRWFTEVKPIEDELKKGSKNAGVDVDIEEAKGPPVDWYNTYTGKLAYTHPTPSAKPRLEDGLKIATSLGFTIAKRTDPSWSEIYFKGINGPEFYRKAQELGTKSHLIIRVEYLINGSNVSEADFGEYLRIQGILSKGSKDAGLDVDIE